MRIAYVAKHDSGGNDDEGAIAHALESLGHDVKRIPESQGEIARKYPCDLVLFHKWDDIGSLRRIKVPKVYWYFDLVDYPDATIARRCQNRIDWMNRITPLVDIGFCTDGDWVNRDTTGKLVRLLQGADQRIATPGEQGPLPLSIVFTGIKNGGTGRSSFVDWMSQQWNRGGKNLFFHVQKIHGVPLANLIATSRIVVAPDAPITDHYWSNRVYLMLGFRAFLLHPYCSTLTAHYKNKEEIVYYRSRGELRELILHYLKSPDERRRIAQAGYNRTIAEHLYVHRCQQLIETVKQRLGI